MLALPSFEMFVRTLVPLLQLLLIKVSRLLELRELLLRELGLPADKKWLAVVMGLRRRRLGRLGADKAEASAAKILRMRLAHTERSLYAKCTDSA